MGALRPLLLTCLLAGAAAQAAEPPLPARQPDIDAIVRAISPQRIDANIRKLVSFGTRHTMSDTESPVRGIGAARRWIRAELERCGAGRLEVSFDSTTNTACATTRACACSPKGCRP